ncbi:GNAT family N-acetyltransferase [Candidatus Dojkabacteria bacterium]|nr:GNAT family N-acetyltransferase [Candidatus Dojkabacteria bacterium]
MNQLDDLYCRAFGREVTEAGRIDLRTHMREAHRIGLIMESKSSSRVAGFASYNLLTTRAGDGFFHLGGLLVFPDFQGRGLGSSFLQNLVDREGTPYFGFHTQNTAMLRTGGHLGQYSEQLTIQMAYSLGSIRPEKRGGLIVDCDRYPPGGLYGQNTTVRRINGLGPRDAGIFCFLRNKS